MGPTQPYVQQVKEAISPGAKWLRHEVDHSLPCAEIENAWSYTSTTPTYSLRILCDIENIEIIGMIVTDCELT